MEEENKEQQLNFREFIKDCGYMSPNDFAVQSRIPGTYVYAYANGRLKPTFRNIVRIADALGVPEQKIINALKNTPDEVLKKKWKNGEGNKENKEKENSSKA